MLNFVFMCQADFKDKTVYKQISRFRSPNDVFLKIEAAGTAPLKVSVVCLIKHTSVHCLVLYGHYTCFSEYYVQLEFKSNNPT